MAPFANAIAEVMLPVAHQLLARDSTVKPQHQGKTPEQWDKEGRYNYEPSFAAAVMFLALYVAATVINLFQYALYRAWFWWPMNLAVISESRHSLS